MIQNIIDKEGFRWIDALNPNEEELNQIAAQYSIPYPLIQDCLEPEHLPKIEKLDEATTFVIVRAFGDKVFEDPEASTVQELTRKVAVFFNPNFFITIHRKELSFFSIIKEKWARARSQTKDLQYLLLVDLLTEVVWSYEPALGKAEESIDDYEKAIFKNQAGHNLIEDIYFLKRKVSVIKKMLRRILDVVHKLEIKSKSISQLVQSLREDGDRLFFFSDQLMESIDNVLAIDLSLKTQKTNNVMRVLTLFSVYFMPLTFIVGIYGMNFRHMPELEEKWGYPAVWFLMLAVVFSIYTWFRRRGWLK